MKKISVFVSLFIAFQAYSAVFEKEAQDFAYELRVTMMTELAEKIKSAGVVQALPFCHVNQSEGSNKKFSFGRTSHQLRNVKNSPEDWMKPYLEQFQGTMAKNKKSAFISGKLEGGKKFFLEPLYTQTQCLSCHGDQIATDVARKLSELYPDDKAVGFKAGEFRGFIWIREK